jgi:alkaline phosphatase D
MNPNRFTSIVKGLHNPSADTPGRREFLETTALAAAAVVFNRAPAIVRQESARPAMAYGSASGDVTRDRAIIWSRSDRPARMRVEWATNESFQNLQRTGGSVARDATGFTARVDLRGLPPSQRIFYRVRFEDLSDSRNVSPPAAGSFMSAPDRGRDLTFAWSADTVGQGWGINPDWGGMRMYETMRRARPDFFIHCGDTIYADGPLSAAVPLSDGTIWRNIVTPAKSKVAETLDEFRGNHLYNLLDENVRRFNSEVAQLTLWDDHEVRNNWHPATSLESDARYTIKNIALLSSNARRAFLEHVPIRLTSDGRPQIFRSCRYGPLVDVFALDLRSYRGPNSQNRQASASASTALAGARQLEWLQGALAASKATWKVIASDLPIGLIVPDGENAFEAFANGNGPPLGRELEVAQFLRFINRRRIRNVVWLTGDVHYAAAHHYDPARARFKDFHPFWEFVGGPLHAGTFGPAALDDTFGPEVRFLSIPPRMAPNRPPTDGLQFFGTASIHASDNVMTIRLHNLKGETIYAIDLEPERP